MKNLYLIGFMGAGKSTIAWALAKKCPAKRIVMDQLIEEQQGMAITDIFAAYNFLCYTFLTVKHDVVDKFGNNFIVVYRIR